MEEILLDILGLKVLDDNGLVEIVFIGLPYSWFNNKACVAAMLSTTVANHQLIKLYRGVETYQ